MLCLDVNFFVKKLIVVINHIVSADIRYYLQKNYKVNSKNKDLLRE